MIIAKRAHYIAVGIIALLWVASPVLGLSVAASHSDREIINLRIPHVESTQTPEQIGSSMDVQTAATSPTTPAANPSSAAKPPETNTSTSDTIDTQNGNTRSAKVESSGTPDRIKTRLQTSDSLISLMTQNQNSSAPKAHATLSSQREAAAPTTQSTTVGPNLIANPSFETTEASGLPTGWLKGGYGTNTRVFTYPATPSEDGTKAARVAITSYTSGDAKWYFNEIPVTSGDTYQFSDYSTSNVASAVDVQYTMTNGAYTYNTLIPTINPSSSYQLSSIQFVIPAGVKAVTIFHYIEKVGSLTVDNYSLNKVSTTTPPPPPPPANNIVPNPDFETAGTTGLPAQWNKDVYGSNSATFSYPVTGINGSKAAKVQITSYTSGDAKWYFNPVSASPGIYSYFDSYMSNESNTVTVQIEHTDGTFSYHDIQTLPAASSFTTASGEFSVPSNTKSVTVFHLIQGVGFLTIDHVVVQKKTDFKGIFTTGAASIRFDDGWDSQYKTALPKLNSLGLKGTFYIVSHQILDNDYSGFVSKAQVQQMFAQGHEIAAHTRTHPDLTTLSATQQQNEIAGSRQDIQSWNVGPVLSFAYPYGSYNTTTIQIVKNAGFTSGATTIGGDVTPTSDPYQLERRGVERTTTVAQVKQWIDQAAANKEWLILVFHRIDTSGDQYSTTPANFNAMMDYLKSKGIPTVTVTQGMQSMQ